MLKQNTIFQYCQWHFVDMPKGLLRAWKNCLRFNLNYWSLILLIRTFFSHWRRYRYSYGRGFSFGRYFEAFSFNIISRALGALMRSVLIVLGIVSEALVFLTGAAVFLSWLALIPLLLIGVFYGFKLLF